MKEIIQNDPLAQKNESIISRYDRMHFGIIRFVHETLYGLFENPFENIMRRAELRQGQRVLEVGCGPGYFTIQRQMVGANGHVDALDINPAAVEYMRRKIKRLGTKNVEVMLADASASGLPDNGVDVAFLFGVIHAFPNLGEVLREMHRVLKPNGKLSIQSRKSEKQMLDSVTSGLFHSNRRSGESLYSPKSLNEKSYHFTPEFTGRQG